MPVAFSERALDDRAIESLLQGAERMRSPFSAVHIQHWGGAVAGGRSADTAFVRRDEPFVLNVIGGWTDASESDGHIAWARQLVQAIQPSITGGAYVNFLGDEGETRVRAAYGTHYDRLIALKDKYDPTNVFRLNQNIKPSGDSR